MGCDPEDFAHLEGMGIPGLMAKARDAVAGGAVRRSGQPYMPGR